MPTCLHCDRAFVNREALHQHIASSSTPHPCCDICDRRFISGTARDAHMASKHPPTFECTICIRSFASPGALDDHYRGSVVHPNCSKCGKGFKDSTAQQEHRKSAHTPIPCGPCGGIMIDRDSQEAHYKSSQNHPACSLCERAFRDEDAFIAHIDLIHTGEDPKEDLNLRYVLDGRPSVPRPPARTGHTPVLPLRPTAVGPMNALRALPPPSAATNQMWGSVENIQAPPRFSRRIEIGPQPRVNAQRLSSWRV